MLYTLYTMRTIFVRYFVFSRKKPWLIFSSSLLAFTTCLCFSLSAARTFLLYIFVVVVFHSAARLFSVPAINLFFIYFYLVLYVKFDSVNLLNVYDRTIIHGQSVCCDSSDACAFSLTTSTCKCDAVRFSSFGLCE